VPISSENIHDQLCLFKMNDFMEKQSILVVDDDIATRSLVVDAISQFDNYTVIEACDGIEGLERLQEKFFDLVICDVMMPGMNGMDLLDRIREINPTTHVILITAYPTIDLTVSAMKTGAVDFLAKPFNIDDLIYKVDFYLREKSMLGDSNNQPPSTALNNKISDISTSKLYI